MTAAIALGNVPAWVALALAVAAAWTLIRGKAGDAVGILQKSNEVLSERVKELEKETKAQAATIAELQARTDFTVALEPVVKSLSEHEHNSAKRGERFERLLDVLELLAARLGPEPNEA
jgi:response regulator RpfG family c-di-GMP phosphodiesterase